MGLSSIGTRLLQSAAKGRDMFVSVTLLTAVSSTLAAELSRLPRYGDQEYNALYGGGGPARAAPGLYGLRVKRRPFGADSPCQAFEPFRCPEEGRCISIQYLCDGAPDCSDGYDEDPRLCTAARRPPVEETSSFLKSLLASHGPNYLEKLFGPKARNNLQPLGGVDQVAIALAESQTIEDFGEKMKLQRTDVEHLRSVFMAVENGDIGMLKSLGIRDSELGDVKFFLEKLVNTGFLD